MSKAALLPSHDRTAPLQEKSPSEQSHARTGELNITKQSSSDELTCWIVPSKPDSSAAEERALGIQDDVGWKIFERDVERLYDAHLERMESLLGLMEDQELEQVWS